MAKFEIGTELNHKHWGKGVVVKVKEREGLETVYTLDFGRVIRNITRPDTCGRFLECDIRKPYFVDEWLS